MINPFSLTFGVEFEFAVAYNLAEHRNHAGLKPECLVHSYTIDVLRGIGLQVNERDAPTDYSKWTVGSDGSIEPRPEDPPLPEGHDFFGVEIKTPIFYWSENDAAFQSMKIALHALQSNLRTFTNSSCGLHVHVGNRDLGFPGKALKRFTYLVTVFQDQLASLHPYHRVNNVHCRGPDCNCGGNNVIKNIITIHKLRATEELINLMRSNTDGTRRGFAYNMSGLLDDGEPPTIEFRQHAATLEFMAVAAWVSLACGLVEKSFFMSHEELFSLFSRGLSDVVNYNILDLLTTLGMSGLAAYYSNQTLHQHPKTNGPLSYQGKAWVDNPTAVVADGIINSKRAELQTFIPNMTQHAETSGDAEMARRMALGLRTQRKSARPTFVGTAGYDDNGNLNDDIDWDVKYALYDVLDEVRQDDEEDLTYR